MGRHSVSHCLRKHRSKIKYVAALKEKFNVCYSEDEQTVKQATKIIL